MKQKGTRRGLRAVLTLLLCLQMVFPIGNTGNLVIANAASKSTETTVKFAASVRSKAKKNANKAGADTDNIAVAKVVNYTNIYSQAGEKGTLKGRLYRGSAAYIIKTSGNYCYISSGELTGWAKKKCLVTGTAAAALVDAMNPRVATVKSSTLNVRSSASSSSRIKGELEKGTSLVVASVDDDWVKVRLTNSEYGYIYKSYTKINSGLYTGVTIEQEKAMKSLLSGESSRKSTGKNDEDDEDEDVDDDAASESVSSRSADGNWVSLGTFKLTAYCPCARCNGAGNAGKTATGAKPVPNHTIAVDRTVIPLGSKIKIAGSDTVYVAEDTGVKGNHIDVLFATHSETGVFGVKYKEVYILKD